jgi:tetratricopeptide (TPR) repeat protein
VALPHATRAVDVAPLSPEMRNTLGSVLQALGRHQEARAQYEKALRLDAALNSICDSLVAGGDAPTGVLACDLAYATGHKLGQGQRR